LPVPSPSPFRLALTMQLGRVQVALRIKPLVRTASGLSHRSFSTFHALRQQQQQRDYDPDVRPSVYKTHGRALFKALTLAFFSYQVVYWAWLTVETEEVKDEKNREISSLESEVRLLDEGRKSHRPAESG